MLKGVLEANDKAQILMCDFQLLQYSQRALCLYDMVYEKPR